MQHIVFVNYMHKDDAHDTLLNAPILPALSYSYQATLVPPTGSLYETYYIELLKAQ